MIFHIKDHDPFDYCPVKSGIGPSSPKVPALGKQSSPDILEEDPLREFYCWAKAGAERYLGKPKVYQNRLNRKDNVAVNRFLGRYINSSDELSEYEQYPEELFDFLAMQVPEDFVVVKMVDGVPRAQLIHLHHPNGWSADGQIGQSFAEIHEGVTYNTNGKLVLPQANKMAAHFCKAGGRFERIGAISFRPTSDLNRYPSFVEGHERAIDWSKYDPSSSNLFMRFERQTIVGLPDIDAFLFTIKTYSCDVFKPERNGQMLAAFSNISPDAYSNWFLDEYSGAILDRLLKESKL